MAVSWKILVVDDDIDIINLISAFLDPLRYQGIGIELLTAHSVAGALKLFEAEHNIAVAYVDLHMETKTAGLELIEHLRKSNIAPNTRIFLFTGNTDQAPRWETTQRFDLDGYLDKGQIDRESLLATTYSAIRSYDLIVRLDKSRQSIFNAVRMLKALDEADKGAAVLDSVIARLLSNAELTLQAEASWSWESNNNDSPSPTDTPATITIDHPDQSGDPH